MAGYSFTRKLANPSFPEYVKIGYAADVKQRLEELNRSSAVPFAFRIYATYEVDSALSDKKLHTILDKLNPELRSQEEIDGKKRIREFYAMTPEDAFAILEAIAEINNYTHRLKKWKATAAEQRDENTAQENREAHQERFAFSKCRIGAGGVDVIFTSVWFHVDSPFNYSICFACCILRYRTVGIEVCSFFMRTPLADLHGSGGGFRHYVLFQADPFGEFQQGNTEALPVFQCHL